DMLYARIPAERLGVLIGPDGVTKQRLQQSTGTRIAVDSMSGEVTIDETGASDPVLALKARDIVHAMARGFSEDRAFRLLDEDAYLEVLDIKDFAHSKNRVAQIRARLIGTRASCSSGTASTRPYTDSSNENGRTSKPIRWDSRFSCQTREALRTLDRPPSDNCYITLETTAIGVLGCRSTSTCSRRETPPCGTCSAARAPGSRR